MKILLLTLIALTTSAGVHAQAQTVKLTETKTVLPVSINSGNLKFSRADYAMPVVKVLVPELAGVTILDHRNTNEGAPCLAAYEAARPEDVIQNNPAVEQIEFTVTLSKELYPNAAKGTCDVYLVEDVNGTIRGFAFTHNRTQHVGTRNIADCR